MKTVFMLKAILSFTILVKFIVRRPRKTRNAFA